MVLDNKILSDIIALVNKDFETKFKPFPGIDTIATHAGYEPKSLPDIGSPVIVPISLSSTFEQTEPGVAKYDYSRANNYTRECLEKCIAELEGGGMCSVFASGLAALAAVTQLLDHGNHIVCFDDLYGGSGRFLRTVASKAGLLSTPVDMRDLKEFRDALTPQTRMVIIETPSNPLMRIVDIAGVVKICRDYNKDIMVVVDNTFLSSYFQRPLDFGADIVLNSLTKYMNGHSDVVMGALVTRSSDISQQLVYLQMAAGAVPSAFDCYLCLRGLRTLPTRMRTHMRNGLCVARFLEKHPKIERVLHPGLESHPQHNLAMSQMRGFSGMITIYLKASAEDTVQFVKNIKIFCLAESLGGFESLIEIPLLMTHASVPPALREANNISANMLRLSIGLESIEDLLKAIDDALAILP